MKKFLILLPVVLFLAAVTENPAHSYFKRQDISQHEIIGKVIIFDVIDKRTPIVFYEVEVISLYRNKDYFKVFSCPADWKDMENNVDISGVKTEDRLESFMQIFIDDIVCDKSNGIQYFIIKEVKESN